MTFMLCWDKKKKMTVLKQNQHLGNFPGESLHVWLSGASFLFQVLAESEKKEPEIWVHLSRTQSKPNFINQTLQLPKNV